MSVGVHWSYQSNSSFQEGSYVKWLLDQLGEHEHGSPEGWQTNTATHSSAPHVCLHPSWHRALCVTGADLQQGSQTTPSREGERPSTQSSVCHWGWSPAAIPHSTIQTGEKGQAHRALPFGSIPRNVFLTFHALRCWQVCKWQILKDSPLWHSAIAKSWTNRLLSTIWLLWLPQLNPWTTSSKNANFSYSKCVWHTTLNKLILKNTPWNQGFPRMMKGMKVVFAEEEYLALEHFACQWCQKYCIPMMKVDCSLTCKSPITRFLLEKAIQSQKQSAHV